MHITVLALFYLCHKMSIITNCPLKKLVSKRDLCNTNPDQTLVRKLRREAVRRGI